MSIIDAINLPMRTIHALYIMAFARSKADEKEKEEEKKKAAKQGKKYTGRPPTMEDLQELVEEGG